MSPVPPDSTLLIMIRHGVTDWNREHRFQGQIDIPLSLQGVQQAERLGASFRRDESISAIYSSDLSRAFSTAEPIARARGLPIVKAVGLRERSFGKFEGMTLAEIQRTHADEYQRWRSRELDFAIDGGGESLNVFFRRVRETMVCLAEMHTGQSIVLLTHGGVLDCAYRATGAVALTDPFRPELHNTGVNRLLYRSGQFELQSWGDIGHLQQS